MTIATGPLRPAPEALDHYRLLGKSGLRVSPLCLGTMTFGTEWGWGADEQESRRMLDLYAERGGNFIDTANLYTNGTSETFLGRLLRGRRHRFVLGTKLTSSRRTSTASTWSSTPSRSAAWMRPATSIAASPTTSSTATWSGV